MLRNLRQMKYKSFAIFVVVWIALTSCLESASNQPGCDMKGLGLFLGDSLSPRWNFSIHSGGNLIGSG